MGLSCISCNQPIENSNYRLIGVAQGTWTSLYAHRGECEAEARKRYTRPLEAPRRSRRGGATPEPEPIP